MTSEWVAVPTVGMHRWLPLELARSLGASDPQAGDGVAANITFTFPDALRQTVLGAGKADGTTDPWQVEHLVWAVLDVLHTGNDDDRLGPLTILPPRATWFGRARRPARPGGAVERRAGRRRHRAGPRRPRQLAAPPVAPDPRPHRRAQPCRAPPRPARRSPRRNASPRSAAPVGRVRRHDHSRRGAIRGADRRRRRPSGPPPLLARPLAYRHQPRARYHSGLATTGRPAARRRPVRRRRTPPAPALVGAALP